MDNKFIIFLSGGMSGLTEEQATKWRHLFKEQQKLFDAHSKIKLIDPTENVSFTKTYTQQEQKEYMFNDLFWIEVSDLIVVNLDSLNSIGTAQEISLAYHLNKPIIGLVSSSNYKYLHPWYLEECIKIFQYKELNNDDFFLIEQIQEIYKYINTYYL